MTPTTPTLVDGCAFLARRLHKDQTYGEDQPYMNHLEAVAVTARCDVRLLEQVDVKHFFSS